LGYSTITGTGLGSSLGYSWILVIFLGGDTLGEILAGLFGETLTSILGEILAGLLGETLGEI